MRPQFEKVTVPEGASWAMLNRRLDDGIPFQWHYHPEFELTLTLNSRGQRYVGDHIGAYDDGDLVLLGPNLPHTWYSDERIDERDPHVALVMWFAPGWAEGLTATLTEMRAVEAMLAAAGRGIAFSKDAATAVRPIVEDMPGLGPVERLIALIEVLCAGGADDRRDFLASPGFDPATMTPADRGRIERVLDHIHASYREPVTIATLAEIACLSVSGFHRLFRRHTRMTVGDYVAQLRIGQACNLLINSSLPIAHIGDEVGYANLANFNRQFKAVKQVTPREFRRSFS